MSPRIWTGLLGVFFALTTAILLAVGLTLVMPGTSFDAIWLLRPSRQAMLMPYRMLLGPGFLALTVPMALAGFGCFARRPWARRLAIAIFAANGTGDFVQLLMGHAAEGLIGIAVAGLLVYALTRPRAKEAFARALS